MLNNSNNNLKSFSSPFSPQIFFFDIKGVSDEKKRRRRRQKLTKITKKEQKDEKDAKRVHQSSVWHFLFANTLGTGATTFVVVVVVVETTTTTRKKTYY